MTHHGIDPESLRLMIRLQLEDANTLIASEGSDRDTSDDGSFALRLYKRELDHLSSYPNVPSMSPLHTQAASSTGLSQPVTGSHATASRASDTQLPPAVEPISRTVDNAVRSQGPTESQPAATGSSATQVQPSPASGNENDNASRKRQRVTDPVSTVGQTRVKSEEDEGSAFVSDGAAAQKRPRLTNGAEPEAGINEGSSGPADARTTGSSGTDIPPEAIAEVGASTKPKPPVKTIVCTACTTEIAARYATIGSCGHRYCRACTRKLFIDAIRNESTFPPKCCDQDLPIRSARKLLTKSMINQFSEREVEHDTVDKTYCSGCSAFVPPANIAQNLATCPKCQTETCTICKSEKHVGEDCPEDEGTKQLQNLANEKQWKACPRCKFMVEKANGCNHISCRCGHQFCYLCGADWRLTHPCRGRS